MAQKKATLYIIVQGIRRAMGQQTYQPELIPLDYGPDHTVEKYLKDGKSKQFRKALRSAKREAKRIANRCRRDPLEATKLNSYEESLNSALLNEYEVLRRIAVQIQTSSNQRGLKLTSDIGKLESELESKTAEYHKLAEQYAAYTGSQRQGES